MGGGGVKQKVVCQTKDSNVGQFNRSLFVSNTIQTESTNCSQRTYLSQLVSNKTKHSVQFKLEKI